MFKGSNKYYWIFGGLFVLVLTAQYVLPTPPDWSRNYLGKSKSAFGCYAIYTLLDEGITSSVQRNDQTLYLLNDRIKPGASVLLVNDAFNFNKNDILSIKRLLNGGHDIFLAASHFDGPLADSLHIETQNSGFGYLLNFNIDSLISRPGIKVSMTASNLKKKSYAYPRLLDASSFSRFDSTRFKVMATYGKNESCLIKTKMGNGTLYFMSIPDVFGNYFIAGHENRSFVYNVLSVLNKEYIVWDEHYKTMNPATDSIFKFIFDSDSLYYAYLLMLAALILYMIFGSRRSQRAIPVKEEVTNTTLEFVDVISHVYYNSKTHRHIAAEKIKYFYESLRYRFGVDTASPPENISEEISTLSGVTPSRVKQMLVYCNKLAAAESVSDHELAELNRQIYIFNKNSLR